MGEPNYKHMYAILCKGISDALDLLPDTAENRRGLDLLQSVLNEAEELYISADTDA